MTKLNVRTVTAYTLDLTEDETRGLRTLLGSGTTMTTLQKLSLQEVFDVLSKNVASRDVAFREMAKVY